MEKTFESFLKKFARSLPEGFRFIDPKDKHQMELLSGAAVAFTLRVLGTGLAFGFNLLLARTVGADDTGLFFLALTLATLASVAGRLGLDGSLLRFVASHAAAKDWKAVKGVYTLSMRSVFIASGILSLLLFLLAPWISQDIFGKPKLAAPLRWMSLSILPTSLLMLQAEALKGLKRIRDSVLVFGVGVPALSLLGLLVVGGRWNAGGAAFVFLVASILVALLGRSLWRSATPNLGRVRAEFDAKELKASSTPLFWTLLFESLVTWMSFIFLGLWATKEEIGIFGVALRTAMVVSLVLISVNIISAPKFAALYKQRKMKQLGETAKQSAKLMTLFSGPVLAVFLVFPGFIMGLFGQEFRTGALLLAVLAVGQFVNVATGSMGYLLAMSGHEELLKRRALLTAALCLVLNAALIPPFGPLGAAIATSASLAATNLIAVYFVRTRLGISTLPTFR